MAEFNLSRVLLDCHQSVTMLRRVGLTDTQIGLVLAEVICKVRQEEHRRYSSLIQAAYPMYVRHDDVADKIGALIDKP